MKSRAKHFIQKHSISIEFQNLDDAFGVQNKIAEVFYAEIQPRMEVLFDEQFGKNYFVSIDRLEIDCGVINKKNWEQEFAEEAIRKLKSELIQINKKEYDFTKAEADRAAELFFFYIKNGFLQWNNDVENLYEFENRILLNDQFVMNLKEIISQSDNAAHRLASQFSQQFISKIIEAIAKEKKQQLEKIYLMLERLSSFKLQRQMIHATIIKTFSERENKNRVREFFISLLSKSAKDIELKSDIIGIIESLNDLKINESRTEKVLRKDGEENEKEINKNKRRDKPELIYIRNAGLILLHPFLQMFFEQLKLSVENKWVDEASQHKAVLILEFLGVGTEEFEEFNLMLNKILCGMLPDDIVTTNIQLDEIIKKECDDLLNSIIKHWNVLKNTSREGLRETFLVRNGKLSKVDNGWRLQVEQKSLDILLGHLPWGIGLIKLPWMKEMLHVEWT